jgi:hypothetical protein
MGICREGDKGQFSVADFQFLVFCLKFIVFHMDVYEDW